MVTRRIDSIEDIKSRFPSREKDFELFRFLRVGIELERTQSIWMGSSIWALDFCSDWNPTLLEFYSIVIRALFTENSNFDRSQPRHSNCKKIKQASTYTEIPLKVLKEPKTLEELEESKVLWVLNRVQIQNITKRTFLGKFNGFWVHFWPSVFLGSRKGNANSKI